MDGRKKLTDPVLVAMQKVLQAEQDAAHELSETQNHANSNVNNARATARTIRQRTDERLSGIQVDYTKKIDRELSQLRELDEYASKSERENSENTILDETIERLVQKLTGDEHAYRS